MVNINGHDFKEITVRDSYNRRALQYKGKILNSLKAFGLTVDDVDIPMERVALRKAPATVAWYMWNEHLFFSYNGSTKFVDNLAMVAQVVEYFIQLLSADEMSQEAFIEMFIEDEDIIEQRIKARETLGFDEGSTDFEEMHKVYKKLSKEHHPDMPNGDNDRFKEINLAHKVLKKELC